MILNFKARIKHVYDVGENYYYIKDDFNAKDLDIEYDDLLHVNQKLLVDNFENKIKNQDYFLSEKNIRSKINGGLFSRNNWKNFKNENYSGSVLFGFGNNDEGIFFTNYNDHSFNFYCLFSSGEIFSGSVSQFADIETWITTKYDFRTKKYLPSIPTSKYEKIKFNDPKITSFFESCLLLGFDIYTKWENNIIANIESEKNLLAKSKLDLIAKLDKDNNGIIDIIEDKNEFIQLLKKHQKLVIEKGKEFNQNYTHQFIKVGNYIKQKKSNLQLIFNLIIKVEEEKDFNEYKEILEYEIHSYNLLLIKSLSMIVSLIDDDQLTFYDIYEKFDTLNIFNSNWENEVSQKLTNINTDIKYLMYEIRDIGNKITSSINDLSYFTESSIRMLDNRLSEIDSSIQTNNLLTLINTYQTYKVNKNTKSLRG